MEDSQKSSSNSKIIKVHKNNSSGSDASSTNTEWIGIRFSLPGPSGTSSVSNITNKEQEIRVINLEQAEELPPVMMLFPDLKEEEMGCSIKCDISTTNLLRLLKGKKANKVLMKPAKRLINTDSMPSIVEEFSSTDLLSNVNNPSTESSVVSVNGSTPATDADYDADESSVE